MRDSESKFKKLSFSCFQTFQTDKTDGRKFWSEHPYNRELNKRLFSTSKLSKKLQLQGLVISIKYRSIYFVLADIECV